MNLIINTLKKIEKKVYKFIYDQPNFTGLRLLSIVRADIWLLPLYFFVLQNRKRLIRYTLLRLKGNHYKVVFVTGESDGRFKKILNIADSTNPNEIYYFELPIICFSTEIRFFMDHFWEFCKTTGRSNRYVDVFACYYSPNNIENRNNYAKVAEKILNIFIFFFNPKLIVSGSGADQYAVELIRIAKAKGIKWMICEREGSHSEVSSIALGKLFASTNPLYVDSIVVTNPLHEQCFKIACNNSVDTRVLKLGELRSDRWHTVAIKPEFKDERYKIWNQYKHKILFLVFGERSYIEPMDHPHVSGDWKALLADIEDEILDFALKNPSALVFYKMGHMEDNNAHFLNYARTKGAKNIIALDRVFPCEELIQYCDLILGFQTTAIIESMFTNKPIIYPFWNFPQEVNPEKDILPIHNMNAVHTVKSKSQFGATLSEWISGKLVVPNEQLMNRKKWREFYFHQPDGKVSERVIKEIHHLLGV